MAGGKEWLLIQCELFLHLSTKGRARGAGEEVMELGLCALTELQPGALCQRSYGQAAGKQRVVWCVMLVTHTEPCVLTVLSDSPSERCLEVSVRLWGQEELLWSCKLSLADVCRALWRVKYCTCDQCTFVH